MRGREVVRASLQRSKSLNWVGPGHITGPLRGEHRGTYYKQPSKKNIKPREILERRMAEQDCFYSGNPSIYFKKK